MPEPERPPHGDAAAGREILTVEQAAAYLKMHKVTVYKYIRAGLLPAVKLGKVYRVYRPDVEALLNTLRTGR